MELRLSCPSKAFIAGEYLALYGGPALLAGLHPRFTLTIRRLGGESGQPEGLSQGGDLIAFPAPSHIFHPASPAGKLFLSVEKKLLSYSFVFSDPHKGRGGFGASTAQFLLLWAFLKSLELKAPFHEAELDLKLLHQDYLFFSKNEGEPIEGLKPSGVDLLCQCKGGFEWIERESGIFSEAPWPFADHTLLFVPTGNKLATHDHLKELRELSENHLLELREAMKLLLFSLTNGQLHLFVKSLEDYQNKLKSLGYLASGSAELLLQFKKIPGVLAGKALGAMGADVILLLVEKSQMQKIQQQVFTILPSKERFFSLNEDLSEGLKIEGSIL